MEKPSFFWRDGFFFLCIFTILKIALVSEKFNHLVQHKLNSQKSSSSGGDIEGEDNN